MPVYREELAQAIEFAVKQHAGESATALAGVALTAGLKVLAGHINKLELRIVELEQAAKESKGSQ